MADEILSRDQNHVPVVGGVTDNVAAEIRALRIDPVTGRLLVSMTGVLTSTTGQYKTFLTVGSSNADYITTGTADNVQIQAAVTAAGNAGGGIVMIKKGSYVIAAAVAIPSNVTLMGENQGAVTLSSTMTASANRGLLTVSNVSNVIISHLGFSVNGGTTGITSYGHENLKILNCNFTGTTNTTDGIIHFEGGNGTAPFRNSLIANCYFYDMTTSGYVRTIHLYARNSNVIEGVEIHSNKFRNVYGVATFLDQFTYIRNINVHHNSYIDLPGGGTVNNTALALQTRISDGGNYYVEDLNFHHNYYKNTLTTADNALQNQGLIFAYSGKRFTIENNHAEGAYTTANGLPGPCIAPGRTTFPQLGLIIRGNFIKGFDAAWDHDATKNTEVCDNIVVNCGSGFIIGYSTQEYVHVHDNLEYNSISPTYLGVIFGNASPVKSSYRNNVIIDNRNVPAPSGVTATVQSGGSLTATTTYYYKVTATDDVGETIGSSEVNGITTSSNKKIKIQWNRVIGAISYKIYRSTTSGTYGATSLLSTNYTNTTTGNYTDDGTVALTTGTVPGVSTVAAAVMVRPIELTGNFDFSDVQVDGNIFYLPNSTFTSELFYKENGSEVSPSIVNNNQIHDSTGRSIDFLHAQGNVTGATTFNSTNARIITATLTGDITVTLSSGTTIGQTLQLLLSSGTGSHTATWPSNFKRAGGSLILSTTASVVDVIRMYWDGTNWYEVSRAISDQQFELRRIITSISSPATAGAVANTDYVYLVTGTTALTLPTAVGNINQYTAKCVSGATTVATTSAQTINGSSTVSIAAGSALTFISDNANWHVV